MEVSNLLLLVSGNLVAGVATIPWKRDCVTDAVPLYQYTRYSFRRPWKDDRLSQPPGVLVQRPTGLELRTLGSQAATQTIELTPGWESIMMNIKGTLTVCNIYKMSQQFASHSREGICQS